MGEIVNLAGCRGKPGILIRPEIFNGELKNSAIPKQIGTVVDIAPINQEERSVWLMLAESGAIIRWDADTGERTRSKSDGRTRMISGRIISIGTLKVGIFSRGSQVFDRMISGAYTYTYVMETET